MRLAPLAALLILSCLSSASLAPFPYEKFIPENMSYSVENFTHQNQTYQMVLVQGQQYAILAPGNKSFWPIIGSGTILEPLYSYYKRQGYSPDAVQQLSQVHAGIDSIRGARKSGEAACRTLIGSDRNSCDSFEHCLQACYAVTSFCQPVALGAGRPFVEALWSFENDSILLDRAYAEEEAAFALTSSPTGENLKAYLGSLEKINRRATKAASNPLYDWYSFCFSPDYSMSALTNLQLSAQKSYANFSWFFNSHSAVQNLNNLTSYGIKKMEYLARLEQQEAVAANATNSTNSTISRKDSELLERYNSLNEKLFKLGPYNSSVQQQPANAAKLDTFDPHLSLQAMVLSSVASLLAIGGLFFIYLKLREGRDRL